ncbi:AraC family transcriptional regulator [Listeria booriae]|uniref:zinc ribbon domain-containing protein n=1 Tax=Listeria booriae TaxID=1552123 RepID=UPI00162674CC|nr:zinc ribbon domain-containing protein [Listeria booriae]MBC1574518.1 AraC family transcriptional regulator [Listeria booriae]
MKNCIACGMPLREKEDYPLGDESKDYCKHCAHKDGSMQTYDEKLESMAAFVIKTQGLNEDVAKKVAAEQLKGLPAWQNQ